MSSSAISSGIGVLVLRLAFTVGSSGVNANDIYLVMFLAVLTHDDNQNLCLLPQHGHCTVLCPRYVGLFGPVILSFLNNAPELVSSKVLLIVSLLKMGVLARYLTRIRLVLRLLVLRLPSRPCHAAQCFVRLHCRQRVPQNVAPLR